MPTQKAIVWTPNQYKTLLWRSALLLRYRNRAEIMFLYVNRSPMLYGFRVGACAAIASQSRSLGLTP